MAAPCASLRARRWSAENLERGEIVPEVRIGLIGSGYMGKAHALAYRAVPGVFSLSAQPTLELLADIDAASAERAGAAARIPGRR